MGLAGGLQPPQERHEKLGALMNGLVLTSGEESGPDTVQHRLIVVPKVVLHQLLYLKLICHERNNAPSQLLYVASAIISRTKCAIAIMSRVQ